MDLKLKLFRLYNATNAPDDVKTCFFRAFYKKIKRHPEQLEQAMIKYKMHLNHAFLSLHDAKRSARLLVSNHLYIMLQQLQHYIDQMTGDFVVQKNNYEKAFCNLVGWQAVDDRYYDAYNGYNFIELKKGQASMWFDMVRYAEIYLKIGRQHTITLFIQYDKKTKTVKEIYVIHTKRILTFLKLDKKTAKRCIQLFKQQTRRLNMQASATKNDLKAMSSYIIQRKHQQVL